MNIKSNTLVGQRNGWGVTRLYQLGVVMVKKLIHLRHKGIRYLWSSKHTIVSSFSPFMRNCTSICMYYTWNILSFFVVLINSMLSKKQETYFNCERYRLISLRVQVSWSLTSLFSTNMAISETSVFKTLSNSPVYMYKNEKSVVSVALSAPHIGNARVAAFRFVSSLVSTRK